MTKLLAERCRQISLRLPLSWSFEGADAGGSSNKQQTLES